LFFNIEEDEKVRSLLPTSFFTLRALFNKTALFQGGGFYSLKKFFDILKETIG